MPISDMTLAIVGWIKEKGTVNAPIVLRLGIVFVFLHFGILQLIKPANFVGFLPEFLFAKSYAQTLVMANGVFEIIFGLLLLVGFFTRLSAFLLGAHLLMLTIEFMVEFGFTNDVFARDVGLTAATLAIVLLGPDKWCWDTRKKK